MDTLGKLFGSQARVKILRLFLLNPLEAYDVAMVAEKSKVPLAEARRELSLIKSAGVIADKTFTKEVISKRSKKKGQHDGRATNQLIRKRVRGYQLYTTFPLLSALRKLIFP